MFVIKDLMIRVLPPGVLRADEGVCSYMNACTYLSCNKTWTWTGGSGFAVTGGLPELKAALQQELAEVEAAERFQQNKGLPATLAEAELLEQQLLAALAEVAELKKTLQ